VPHVVVAGRKVYYESHGEHPGTPLVLVMGTGGSCKGWLPLQVPELSQTRRTIIFDHRGVGGSDDPGTEFSTAVLADDVVGLLDTLKIPKADLLGVFMGGMVGQEVALRHPGRLDRLVLVGTFARADAKRRVLLELWRDLARSGAGIDVMVRERLLWTLQDDTLEQTDLIDAMVRFFTRDGAPVDEDVFARQCEACLSHDTADRLREIRHRTLIVCGRHDRLTPPRMHRVLADEIPDTRLVTIDYGAHLVMAESAERFNEVVDQFLSEGR
jgi:pimeloyl-ACP methyl ester carboxylesterase